MNHPRPSSFVHDLIRRLGEQGQHDNGIHQELLVSRSTPQGFRLGTGADLFTHALIPAIASATSEVIFVTCFWAPSKSLSALHDALVALATHRRGLSGENGITTLRPLRFRICLSSRSILQKLLHPQSADGYVYPPSSWQKQLGLPDPALLDAARIDLQVKSLFFLPFSVMHPKFVIIDRQRALIPSCNVSWEPWLEGCVEFTGDAVLGLLSFYSLTWEKHLDFRSAPGDGGGPPPFDARDARLTLVPSTVHYHAPMAAIAAPLPTLLLPSPYHRNPQFRPFPWQKAPRPPGTPLNTALLELLGQAQRSVYVQTPNLTCQAVIVALLDALKRGVSVTVVTSRNMMLLEQLVTAGTTTSLCLRSLIRRFRNLQGGFADQHRDLEIGHPRLGELHISYFHPRSPVSAAGFEGESLVVVSEHEAEEPVHSHLKLTIVDHQFTLLGSGNMDRASWYTSQELGVMFHDDRFAATVKAAVDRVLDGRLHLVFDSTESQD
ncbi:hypothetical protein B0T17DRAFT_501529 [Bombardia bombarda]|uniref:PLD phosphodiesterase domain-containing protein n=1 Tax=Bombardia bombarda TaxID=252184 RepID=A0AA39W9K7_9PEZI|nr:hypothetical protein B0T17DRAFT_501529 [Bombardia bombarda]